MPLSKADIKYRIRRQLCNPVADTVPEEAPGLPDPDYSDRDPVQRAKYEHGRSTRNPIRASAKG
jgi:hypothetical protein